MMAYLSLIPILLLLIAAAALIIVRIIRPATAYFWLIAAVAALLAWLLVLLAYSSLPQSITLFQWQPDWLFSQSPSLLSDSFSWAFAFSLSSLALAAILTEAARSESTDWFVWAAILVLCALGIAGVQAGNYLTLLLIWTAIDFTDIVIYLYTETNSTTGTRYLTSISVRAAGTFLLIWTILYTGSNGTPFEGFPLSNQTGLLLLAAAILRTGVIPLRGTYQAESYVSRSLGTVSRLTTAATGLILVTRAASVGFLSSQTPILVVLAGLAALYCALSWALSRDELDGQAYWILGMAAFAIASALRSQPEASNTWGVAAILAGGLLGLITARHRYLFVIPLIGLLGITALPFTPAWNGILLYSPDFNPPLVLFMFSQSIFMIGYWRYAVRLEPSQSRLERWVWVIYPWGLAMLPVSHYITGWLGWSVQLSLSTVLPGLLVSLLTVAVLVINYRLKEPPRIYLLVRRAFSGINNRVTMNWIYHGLGRIFNSIGRSISFVTAILEGDGGVLWALFFLVLFIAILTQIRLGV